MISYLENRFRVEGVDGGGWEDGSLIIVLFSDCWRRVKGWEGERVARGLSRAGHGLVVRYTPVVRAARARLARIHLGHIALKPLPCGAGEGGRRWKDYRLLTCFLSGRGPPFITNFVFTAA